jgi:monoterpene epsilon-lactone hydrolase
LSFGIVSQPPCVLAIMTAVVTLDQIAAAGARVQQLDGSSIRGRLRRAMWWAEIRFARLYLSVMVAWGRRALKGDAAGPLKFAADLRAIRQFFDHPTAAMDAMIDAEAVRAPGPRLGVPAPPTPAEWFAPRKGVPRGYVFYVHGGSFVFERSPRITALVARFAAAARASVFAPNYRLAPEHPCPAAVEDILAAYQWFKATWPVEPVVALAESAGAAILLAALQRARDEGFELPDGVVLLSPWVDLALQSWSILLGTHARTTPSSMEALALMARLYLAGRSSVEPLASPLYGDFTDFPPTLIHASQTDILYDDAIRLAAAIRRANGELTVRLWTNEAHVWEGRGGEQSRRSIELAAEFIRRRLD